MALGRHANFNPGRASGRVTLYTNAHKQMTTKMCDRLKFVVTIGLKKLTLVC